MNGNFIEISRNVIILFLLFLKKLGFFTYVLKEDKRTERITDEPGVIPPLRIRLNIWEKGICIFAFISINKKTVNLQLAKIS